MPCRPNRHVVAVTPETDFVTRLDTELVAQFLGDDDLAFRAHSMSHTVKYDSVRSGGDGHRSAAERRELLDRADPSVDVGRLLERVTVAHVVGERPTSEARHGVDDGGW